MSDEQHKTKIREFFHAHRRMPNYRELLTLTGFASRASVAKLITRLEKQNFVTKDTAGKILPKHLWGELPVLGVVEAGFPSPAEEYRTDEMSLDEYLIPDHTRSFILTVKGDSMKDAGIIEGDMVIAERTSTARDGDIVIASLDGEYTMKYLRRKNGRSYLEAANARYKPMHPTQSLLIEAVVRGVIRKYRS